VVVLEAVIATLAGYADEDVRNICYPLLTSLIPRLALLSPFAAVAFVQHAYEGGLVGILLAALLRGVSWKNPEEPLQALVELALNSQRCCEQALALDAVSAFRCAVAACPNIHNELAGAFELFFSAERRDPDRYGSVLRKLR
jgi:hypothetical protein